MIHLSVSVSQTVSFRRATHKDDRQTRPIVFLTKKNGKSFRFHRDEFFLFFVEKNLLRGRKKRRRISIDGNEGATVRRTRHLLFELTYWKILIDHKNEGKEKEKELHNNLTTKKIFFFCPKFYSWALMINGLPLGSSK